ncbi:membrane protein [Arthrobacter phage Racecar]|nr:hypothetical protein PBI_RACECAR_12 [Arthrobacter phage Racecar]
MTNKIWGAVLAALMLGVVILAWMNGSYFLASLWGTLGLLMVLEKLNKRYGWSLAAKIFIADHLIAYLKRKQDKKDLASLMEERHKNRSERLTKVK